jgi:hypothetical protein
MRNLLFALALAVLLLLPACTALQPVPSRMLGPKQTAASRIDERGHRHGLARYVFPGEQIRVVTSDNQVHDLAVDRLEDTTICGTDSDGVQQQIALSSVQELDTRRFSLWRTLVLGVPVAAGVVAWFFYYCAKTGTNCL